MMSTQLALKQRLVNALEANDDEAVRTLALQSRKVFSVLVRLAYDKTTLIGWRSIRATGHVATLYVKNNYTFLRDAIRKLLWSLSDESGGIGWSAPEILGEIVSADPVKMSDVIPLIADIFSIDERVFRPGVLYALKRISETEPESVVPYVRLAIRGLIEDDPIARIYALELLLALKGRISLEVHKEVMGQIVNLIDDEAIARPYKNDRFEEMQVKAMAKMTYHILLKN